ncbi:MAG: VCBS repeat-containing protein, partial [Candidatus Paceibacterota bacterium]
AFTIGGTEYPNPERNFVPGQLKFAGDVNGDGRSDFYYSEFAADETTEELSDRIYKKIIYYGTEEGLEESDSELLIGDESNFNFINDITSDGTPKGIKIDGETIFLIRDELGGDLSSFEEIELLNTGFSNIQVVSNGDFDGDGFDDLFIYSHSHTTVENTLYVVKGADSIAELSIDTLYYTAEGNSGFNQLMYRDLDQDGAVEVVQVSSVYQGDSFGYLTVYQLNNEGALEVTDHTELSSDIISSGPSLNNFNGSVGLVDLDDNGTQELIVESENELRVFTLSDTEGEFYNESNIAGAVIEANNFSIIGDYNDDGFPDLLLTKNGHAELLAGNADLELSTISLELEEGETLNVISNSAKNLNSGGDVNGDGLDDIVVGLFIQKEDVNVNGYRVYMGNSSGSFATQYDLIHDLSYSVFSTPTSTFNAGDLNGDGIDDY